MDAPFLFKGSVALRATFLRLGKTFLQNRPHKVAIPNKFGLSTYASGWLSATFCLGLTEMFIILFKTCKIEKHILTLHSFCVERIPLVVDKTY